MYNQNNNENDPFYEIKNTDDHGRIGEQHETIDELSNETFLEETSAEFTHPIREDEREQKVHHIYGWIGLLLSIISFFFIPILFAIAGIIVGVVARNRQSLTLGYSAIVIGILSLIVNLFILPFF